MNASWVDDLGSVNEVVNFLVYNATDQTKSDASHDAILVFDFFPRLGPEFYTSPDFNEEQVQDFVKTFDYERYGLDKETTIKRIEKYRSIDRILDVLVELLSAPVKDDLLRKYLLEVWFKQNSKSDFEHFKGSLVKDYWLKK